MRILFVVRSLDVGGAEQQLVALAIALLRAGHEPTVCVFYSGGKLETTLAEARVPLVSLNSNGRLASWRGVMRLSQIVREMRPHVVHSYMETANVVSAVSLSVFARGVPLVWGIRNSEMLAKNYSWSRRAGQVLERCLARVPALTIANASGGCELALRRGMSRGSVRKIPNGIDCNRFNYSKAKGEALRDEIGVGPSVPLIGLVARLDPMKDHPTFLRAMAGVKRAFPEACFVCVGDGPEEYRSQLQALAQEYELGGSVQWLPARRDIVAVYSALDVLVMSSRYGEGFPNVLGEAMACGCACVATRCGDAFDIVGPFGLTVEPGDESGMAHAVAGILGLPVDERVRRREAARIWIETEYSMERLVTRTVSAFESVASADA